MARGSGGGMGGGGRGGGGNGGGGLMAMLDELDYAMLDDFNEYAQILMEAWNGFSGNEGQMAIVERYILPVVEEHIMQAMFGWPRAAGPDDYFAAVAGAYDAEVIERAFMQTIVDTYEQIALPISSAGGLQEEHDNIAAIMGSQPAPHATEWFGTFMPF